MDGPWHIGVIGGSGLYDDIGLEDAQRIAVKSPFGEPSGDVTLGRLAGARFTFLARHGEGHVLSPGGVNYRANIDVLKRCGVTDVVAISAIGSLREEMAPGHFVAADQVIDARPDVFNHNLETVPRLYLSIRPGARYYHSLRLLDRVKARDPSMFTKSGLMVGLGESKEEVMQVMDDMRSAGVDFITIGQYLHPTRKHAPIDRYWTPDEFKALESIAWAKGFLMVSASPFTRSSHHAGEDFARLKAARAAG